ncbi:MAG: hypothetical protein MdMp014T_0677 [Treponematales bacterium]
MPLARVPGNQPCGGAGEGGSLTGSGIRLTKNLDVKQKHDEIIRKRALISKQKVLKSKQKAMISKQKAIKSKQRSFDFKTKCFEIKTKSLDFIAQNGDSDPKGFEIRAKSRSSPGRLFTRFVPFALRPALIAALGHQAA